MKKTLPGLLAEKAKKWGNTKIALREKQYGIWNELTWQEYFERVRSLTLGLMDLGLKRGDVVTFITTNRPEWLFTELAIMSAGAISLGLYSEMENLDQMEKLLNLSDTRFLIVEDQEQVDKILVVKDKLIKLRKILVDEYKEVDDYNDPDLISFDSVLANGNKISSDQPQLYNSCLEKIQENDIALLTTTSGSTALPKLAMLTHRNFLYMSEALSKIDKIDQNYEFISFLPPAWGGERMIGLAWSLYKGFIVNFAEKSTTVPRDMREIGTYIIFAPPRTWENMAAEVKVRISDATWLKRFIFNSFFPRSLVLAEKKLKSKSLNPYERLVGFLCDIFICNKIKDHLGLTRVKIAFTGGAPLGEDTFMFFHALGLKIRQVYGQSEIGGVAVVHRSEDIRADSVGIPLPGTEIKIGEDGEIMLKSDAVCQGYYNNPKKSAETIVNGWLHTGDQGYLDNEHLIMVDRMGDVLVINGGTKFSPQYLENKLKFSQYIHEAIVFGHQQDYVIALVQIDFNIVGKWAEDHQIPYSTFSDLASRKEIIKLIEDELRKINKSLPKMAYFRRFDLLKKELDPEDDEITLTQKIRRKAINEKYFNLVKQIYAEETGITVL